MTPDEAVSQWHLAPFARGSTDCTAFAAWVVHKLTGKHYLPEYSSTVEAEAIIREHGGLSEAVSHYMERSPVAPDLLKPGDVVIVDILDNEAVGVLGASCVYTVFEDGVPRRLPKKYIRHGWRAWA